MSETKVKIIQPKNNKSKIEETEKKLRVAAYCRVSTNSGNRLPAMKYR